MTAPETPAARHAEPAIAVERVRFARLPDHGVDDGPLAHRTVLRDRGPATSSKD